jgi:hypothetical protein
VQIAVGVQTQIGWSVVPMGQFLAGIAERLKVTDGVWMLERGHR